MLGAANHSITLVPRPCCPHPGLLPESGSPPWPEGQAESAGKVSRHRHAGAGKTRQPTRQCDWGALDTGYTGQLRGQRAEQLGLFWQATEGPSRVPPPDISCRTLGRTPMRRTPGRQASPPIPRCLELAWRKDFQRLGLQRMVVSGATRVALLPCPSPPSQGKATRRCRPGTPGAKPSTCLRGAEATGGPAGTCARRSGR